MSKSSPPRGRCRSSRWSLTGFVVLNITSASISCRVSGSSVLPPRAKKSTRF
ncbi:hypothetical protein PF005_g18452 [Phytophthora fragariae]|uniref:Uncharacterized protein n=1 Tax=Phytophthora fragariae TaxID=53985 RepID=A0A6A3QYH2_9STRA|nr:hypothetical protein PF003_g32051 [Phytophthora fragariae]KAE8930584.1 hypothetical protein PF009_g19330 [Phytophthora fragariae]KAE9008024.1 hypothetical protein PF011_g10872 [Phytophthora fragariae]KAE9085459.1 hypothetical protein PF007_g21137 [Phytophthora fragariae]KAE9106281.1 hypothetical protein PF006_g21404 [Phytophthora fragariae]